MARLSLWVLQPVYVSMLVPIVKMLRALVQHSASLRHRLAHDSALYFAVFRVALLLHKDYSARQECAELLALLLFDEVAATTVDADDVELGGTEQCFSLPSFIVKRSEDQTKNTNHEFN